MQLEKEQLRLAAMKRYLQLYYEAENKLQDIVMIACHITETPVAFITLMDQEVQWVTAKYGYDIDKLPRDSSFCSYTIQEERVFIVNDTLADSRFSNNPIVKFDPGARFYAGASLKSHDGYNIGALCVLDTKPNALDEEQVDCLMALSKQVGNLMELDLSMKLLKESIGKIEDQNSALRKIAQVESHELRGPLSAVMGVMNLIRYENYNANKEYLLLLEDAVKKLDDKICSVVQIADVNDLSSPRYELTSN